MSNINKIIGQRINNELALQNKKQKDLAGFLGVTDNTVSYFVGGKRCPNIEQILKISEFFDVSTDYLLGKSDIKSNDVTFKEVCDFTGLNDYTMKKLLEIKNKSVLAMDCINEALPYALSVIKESINSYVCCMALDKIIERKNVLEFINDEQLTVEVAMSRIDINTSLGFSDILRVDREAYKKFSNLRKEKERKKLFDFEYLIYRINLSFDQAMFRDNHWEFGVIDTYFQEIPIEYVLKLFINDPYVDERYKYIAEKILEEGGWEYGNGTKER